MAAPRRSLAWSHGVATLETLGAMLGPTLFVLPGGRQVAPFHIAPWFEEGAAADQPGILQRLRGEWPCVPFGAASLRPARDGWAASDPALEPDPFAHGFGSNHHWRWLGSAEDTLALAIDYPPSHPIAGLRRWLRPVDGQAAIDFGLCIHPRRDCTLPIGLHPVFRLPERPGAAQLDVSASAAHTFPGQVDPSSIFAPGRANPDWHAIALTDGSSLDPASLPLTHRTEELLQLTGAGGRAGICNLAEGYRVRLAWNAEHFPDVLLWISNLGRRHHPWDGRHLAVGVEPVCSAFDLGAQISASPNAINASGSSTAHGFKAGEVFETRYRVAVDALGGAAAVP